MFGKTTNAKERLEINGIAGDKKLLVQEFLE